MSVNDTAITYSRESMAYIFFHLMYLLFQVLLSSYLNTAEIVLDNAL
jgi:hypothetical protein